MRPVMVTKREGGPAEDREAPARLHSQNSNHEEHELLGEVRNNENEFNTEAILTIQDYLCLEDIGRKGSILWPRVGKEGEKWNVD